jgi:hypothetical protein
MLTTCIVATTRKADRFSKMIQIMISPSYFVYLIQDPQDKVSFLEESKADQEESSQV